MSSPVAASNAPAIPAEFRDPAFKHRRLQNWMVLGLLYAFFYMTRYNLTAVSATLTSQFGWTNSQFGVFETVMPFVYGLSVLFNGPLADRIGGKKAFLFGAVGVALMNVLFGLEMRLVEVPAVVAGKGHAMQVLTPATLKFGLSSGAALALIAVTWGLNGYFQSFGALSIVKVNAQWFHIRERGTFAGIFGVLIRLGLWLGFSVVPVIVLKFGLAWAFLLPGVFVAALFLANLFLMENSPVDAGYPSMDTGDGGGAGDEKPPTMQVLLTRVFANKAAWLIAGASMMVGVVRRTSVDGWWPKYIAETHLPAGMGPQDLGKFLPYQFASLGIMVMGILGGFAFGIASDRTFGSRRAPVITIGFGGMALTLALFGAMNRLDLGPWPAAILLPVMSFFVNGAHGMIGGAASMDFGGKKAAASAAGLFDGIQYLAAAPLAGYGVGRLIDTLGWGAWPWLPIPFALVGAVIIAQLWNVTPGHKPASAPKPQGGGGGAPAVG